jgi:Uma2 family endonuclease
MDMSAHEPVTIEPATADPAGIEPGLIRRISRAEYREMGRAGLFEDERIELLYGQLVVMSPADPSHDRAISELTRLLIIRLAGRADVRPQCSFAASNISEPQPDVVVAPKHTVSWSEHPSEALLVVEISRTSLSKDRGLKSRLYGEVAVAEYWIVDIDGGCVHVLRDADEAGRWQSHRVAQRGETLTVATFPDVTIAVDDIVPPIT